MNFPLPFPLTRSLLTRSPSFFSSHPSHASSLRMNFVFCATTAITFSSSFLRSSPTTLPSPPRSNRSTPLSLANLSLSLSSHSLRRSTSSALVVVCWRSPLRDCMLIGDFGCHLEHCFFLRASDFPFFFRSSSVPTDRSARRSVQISR